MTDVSQVTSPTPADAKESASDGKAVDNDAVKAVDAAFITPSKASLTPPRPRGLESISAGPLSLLPSGEFNYEASCKALCCGCEDIDQIYFHSLK